MRTPSVVLMVAGLAITSAAQAVKYNFEYKCPETVVVRYCRNDEAQKVHELENYCMVEYPDRPRRIESIAFFRSVVKADLAVELTNCKGPGSSNSAIVKAPTANSGAAKAAKPAATRTGPQVFGIHFDDPLEFPSCPKDMRPGPAPATCSVVFMPRASDFETGMDGKLIIRTHTYWVYLAAEKCPSWVNKCTLVVETYDDRVGYIGVITKGPNVDAEVREALAEKYGKSSASRNVTVTPDGTNAQPFQMTRFWWELPGLYIYYEPAWATSNGTITDLGEGRINVENAASRKRRDEKAAKNPKPKM